MCVCVYMGAHTQTGRRGVWRGFQMGYGKWSLSWSPAHPGSLISLSLPCSTQCGLQWASHSNFTRYAKTPSRLLCSSTAADSNTSFVLGSCQVFCLKINITKTLEWKPLTTSIFVIVFDRLHFLDWQLQKERVCCMDIGNSLTLTLSDRIRSSNDTSLTKTISDMYTFKLKDSQWPLSEGASFLCSCTSSYFVFAIYWTHLGLRSEQFLRQ